MKIHFVRKKVLTMRSTKVPAHATTMVRLSPQDDDTKKSAINERLQTLGRMVIQEHLEAFKRLADK